MHCLEEHRPVSNKEFEDLVKNSKNEQFPCILESVKLSNWVRDNGTTMLHLAVIHNNLNLIKYLLNIGYNVDTKNSSGETALLTALKMLNLEAVKILLDADADLSVTDVSTGKTALQIFIKVRIMHRVGTTIIIKDIAPNFLANLKRNNPDAGIVAELLIAAKCPFEYILPVNDVQLNREFLKRNPSGEYEQGIYYAMRRHDLENVKLILHYANNEPTRWAFYQSLCNLSIESELFETWKLGIEHLLEWQTVDKDALDSLVFMFLTATIKYVQILLDSKIHVQVRENFGIDVRACIFGNHHVDAIELLQNQDFNVNAPGGNHEHETALHFAAVKDLIKHTRYLLDSGADVNVKDKRGRTALFNCIKWDSIENGKMLLEYDADAQVVDKKGLSLFGLAESKNSPLLEFLLAKLAISYVQNLPIKQAIQNQIDSNGDYKKTFEECCQQLRLLKTCQIAGSISLLTVLTDRTEMLSRVLRDKETISLLDLYNSRRKLHSLYYSMLKTKLTSAMTLYRFKCGVVDLISETTGRIVDSDHLVLRKISEYLTTKDIDEFVKYSIWKSFNNLVS